MLFLVTMTKAGHETVAYLREGGTFGTGRERALELGAEEAVEAVRRLRAAQADPTIRYTTMAADGGKHHD